MLILGIETSAALCSVAWKKSDQLLLEYNIEIPNIHATLLPELVKEGFKKLNSSPADLNLIAVASGPGSFTGMRIGMSYAMGFGYALDKPIISVTNFEVLAAQSIGNRFPVYAVIDARRGNYYIGEFTKSLNTLDSCGRYNQDYLLKNLAIGGIITTPIKNLASIPGINIEILQVKYSAGILAGLGLQKYLETGIDEKDQLEPLYLHKFAGVA